MSSERKPRTLLVKYFDDTNIRPLPARAERKLQLYPSLGLLYLASTLKSAGYPVEILEANALNLSKDEYLRRLRESKADIVGFSATTVGWPAVVQGARLAREALPESLIVVGGPHLSLYPEECLSFDIFDIGVYGDGEETLLEIARCVEEGRAPENIRGTIMRRDGKVVVNEARPWLENLDAVPYPAVELIPLDRYNCITVEKPFLTLVSSRGCPYKCGFCSQVFCGDSVRLRSPENVVGEIELYVKTHGVREVIMFDETFTVKKERVMEICRLIRQRNLRFRFNVRTRVDTIDEEMMRALKEAGCYGLHMGVESGSPRILKIMRKGITLEKVRESFALARRLGFITRGYFMLGYLDEDRETFKDTVRIARELNLDFASFSLTTPLPATHLFEEAVKRGLIGADYWREYTLAAEPVKEFPHLPSPHWDEETLRKMMLQAYTGFYLRPGYVLGRLGAVRSWRQLKDLAGGLQILLLMGEG